MTLGPPLWATGSWAVDAWADGTWGADAPPAVLGDLTYLFVQYVEGLRDAHQAALDSTTLVANDLATVRAGSTQLDDANTMFAIYLS